MSLDVTILSPTGGPTWTVPVGVELHHRLITAARQFKLPQLSRMSDYYKDVTIEAIEVPNLISDLEVLLRTMTSDRELTDLCQRLLELAQRAVEEEKAIEVIAD